MKKYTEKDRDLNLFGKLYHTLPEIELIRLVGHPGNRPLFPLRAVRIGVQA